VVGYGFCVIYIYVAGEPDLSKIVTLEAFPGLAISTRGDTCFVSAVAISGCGSADVQLSWRVKVFYTGPVINAEMLVVMLEKHGIAATQEFVEPGQADDGDLNRPAKVSVGEADYDRAYRLFYAEREDEL